MPRTSITVTDLSYDSAIVTRASIDTVNGNVLEAARGLTVLFISTPGGTVRITSTHKGVDHEVDLTIGAGEAKEWQAPDMDFFGKHGGADRGALYVDQVGGSSGDIKVAAYRPRRRP